MWNNFKEMPRILWIITGANLVVPVFVIGSLIPGFSVKTPEGEVTQAEWWASGSEMIAILIGVLSITGVVLSLRKSGNSRIFFIIAWIAMAISSQFSVGGSSKNAPDIALVIPAYAVILLAMALYLYRNQSVRKYFSYPI